MDPDALVMMIVDPQVLRGSAGSRVNNVSDRLPVQPEAEIPQREKKKKKKNVFRLGSPAGAGGGLYITRAISAQLSSIVCYSGRKAQLKIDLVGKFVRCFQRPLCKPDSGGGAMEQGADIKLGTLVCTPVWESEGRGREVSNSYNPKVLTS